MQLELPHFLKPALAAGHPWVYRDHVPRDFRAPSGAWVEVSAGNWRSFALWDTASPIALRVYGPTQPDPAWVTRQVQAAWDLRAPLHSPVASPVLESDRPTTAFRWLFGEGDGLPGITVDRYGDYAVLATYADSVDVLVPWVVDALVAIAREAGQPLLGILRRNRQPANNAEPVSIVETAKTRSIWGELPPADLVVQECGLYFRVNLFEGQKTGLFVDQRENRQYVETLASGRRVLNLFAYSGAFGMYAARGGAVSTINVDSAAAALADAKANYYLNGFDGLDSVDNGNARHEFVVADVAAYLEKARVAGRKFDLVVCDPPSLSHSKEQLPQALKAYARLNAAAMRATAKGGLLATASCTAQVSPDAFREALADAARQAGRRLQVIHEVGQPVDHPVMVGHREGRYLKFVVGRVG